MRSVLPYVGGSSVQEQQAQDWVSLDFFTSSRVLSGYATCPKGSRLLDVLNGQLAPGPAAKGAFLEFAAAEPVSAGEAGIDKTPKQYVRKTSIQFVGVPEADLARGAGARPGARCYPFSPKSAVRVSLQLQDYSLSGNLHRKEGQSIQAVLNEETQFLPLTDVTIARESDGDCHLFGLRPFVAVNKDQIISSREEVFN